MLISNRYEPGRQGDLTSNWWCALGPCFTTRLFPPADSLGLGDHCYHAQGGRNGNLAGAANRLAVETIALMSKAAYIFQAQCPAVRPTNNLSAVVS
jgi:hypothetical protein